MRRSFRCSRWRGRTASVAPCRGTRERARIVNIDAICSARCNAHHRRDAPMPSDIDIAHHATLQRISELARERLGIAEEHLEPYGHYKAKISLDYLETLQGRPDGRLILVSAISPTPAGEGKTTTSVGLGDALNRIGRKAMVCLREPS